MLTGAGFEIRSVLTCPKCKERGVVRAVRADDPGVIALRLICQASKPCGVLGVFTPPDPMAWSQCSKVDAAAVIQRFLDTCELPEGAVDILAFAERKDAEIERLKMALRHVAETVHAAYHGDSQHELDACDCDWSECPRAICRHAQKALGVVK